MIFCTTGTQAPFDRFLQIVDNIAPSLGEEIVVQAFHGDYVPQHVTPIEFISPDEFDALFRKARLIVAHAGMGTIINAMTMGKPIVVFPRKAALGEHRNEHQLATVKRMEAMQYVYAAHNEEQLRHWMAQPELPPLHHLGSYAQQSLIDELRQRIG